QVFGKRIESPDSIVTIGGNVVSKTPRRTVSLTGLDDMGAAVAARSAGRGRISALRRVRQFAEPRPNSGECTHEAARSQQLPSPAASCGQKAVQPLLVHLVHVHQTIGGSCVEGGILCVF